MDSVKFGYPESQPPVIPHQPVPPPSYTVAGPSYPPPPPPPGLVSHIPPTSAQNGQRVVTIGTTRFGPYPQNVICPTCNEQVITLTSRKSGLLAWLVSIGCCVVGCVFGCCLIPFYTDITLDVEHSCPRCARKLGINRKIEFN
ncbi:lipopolysaccharide-induced tumor necrosis factor-alpha factor homolog [Panonychus citri]|uniref:lipopolysaccharide-induced tumor necrosis factor-alpha factor homolog n=1 Tax=Panonychus citri TaxID=50023 RepID=UPI0023077089|nr:lipopolysaccharide-induced tumor necrosis factor-alpha factor homolog [Panonychus citri]